MINRDRGGGEEGEERGKWLNGGVGGKGIFWGYGMHEGSIL